MGERVKYEIPPRYQYSLNGDSKAIDFVDNNLKNLYLGKCAFCDESVEDVHHITPQKEANKDGNIEHYHKNHKYNLIPLCKTHHRLVHDGKINISGFVMSSEGLKLSFGVLE